MLEPTVVWTGSLTENGPLMQIVQTKWGQHLEPVKPESVEPVEPEPKKQGSLF